MLIHDILYDFGHRYAFTMLILPFVGYCFFNGSPCRMCVCNLQQLQQGLIMLIVFQRFDTNFRTFKKAGWFRDVWVTSIIRIYWYQPLWNKVFWRGLYINYHKSHDSTWLYVFGGFFFVGGHLMILGVDLWIDTSHYTTSGLPSATYIFWKQKRRVFTSENSNLEDHVYKSIV